MAIVRLFAGAREAAGTGRDEIGGANVDEVIAGAVDRYGTRFADILSTCKIWVNGEPVDGPRPVDDDDEIAVLPPVSGGA